MTIRNVTEGSIQNGIVDFLRIVLPPDHIVYANANAARRTAGGRAGNGVPGLMPGIPDLSVACPGSRILYFEVKQRAAGCPRCRAKSYTVCAPPGALSPWSHQSTMSSAPWRPGPFPRASLRRHDRIGLNHCGPRCLPSSPFS